MDRLGGETFDCSPQPKRQQVGGNRSLAQQVPTPLIQVRQCRQESLPLQDAQRTEENQPLHLRKPQGGNKNTQAQHPFENYTSCRRIVRRSRHAPSIRPAGSL